MTWIEGKWLTWNDFLKSVKYPLLCEYLTKNKKKCIRKNLKNKSQLEKVKRKAFVVFIRSDEQGKIYDYLIGERIFSVRAEIIESKIWR